MKTKKLCPIFLLLVASLLSCKQPLDEEAQVRQTQTIIRNVKKIDASLMVTVIREVGPEKLGGHTSLKIEVFRSPEPDFYQYYICKKNTQDCDPPPSKPNRFTLQTFFDHDPPIGLIAGGVRACVKSTKALNPNVPCGPWADFTVKMDESKDFGLKKELLDKDGLKEKTRETCTKFTDEVSSFRNDLKKTGSLSLVAEENLQNIEDMGDMHCELAHSPAMNDTIININNAPTKETTNKKWSPASIALFTTGAAMIGYVALKYGYRAWQNSKVTAAAGGAAPKKVGFKLVEDPLEVAFAEQQKLVTRLDGMLNRNSNQFSEDLKTNIDERKALMGQLEKSLKSGDNASKIIKTHLAQQKKRKEIVEKIYDKFIKKFDDNANANEFTTFRNALTKNANIKNYLKNPAYFYVWYLVNVRGDNGVYKEFGKLPNGDKGKIRQYIQTSHPSLLNSFDTEFPTKMEIYPSDTGGTFQTAASSWLSNATEFERTIQGILQENSPLFDEYKSNMPNADNSSLRILLQIRALETKIATKFRAANETILEKINSLDTLTQELARAREALGATRNANHNFIGANDQLRAQLEAAKQKIEELTNQLSQKVQDLQDIQAAKAAQDRLLADKEQTIRNNDATIADLQSQLQAAQGGDRDKSAALAAIQAENATLKEEVKNLKAENASLKRLTVEQGKTIEDQAKAIKTHLETIEAKEAKIRDLEADLLAKKSTIEGLTAKLAEQGTNQTETQKQLAQAQKDLADKLKEFETANANQQKTIDELNQSNQKLQTENTKLKTEAIALGARYDDHEIRIKALEDGNVTNKKNIAQNTQNIEQLKTNQQKSGDFGSHVSSIAMLIGGSTLISIGSLLPQKEANLTDTPVSPTSQRVELFKQRIEAIAEEIVENNILLNSADIDIMQYYMDHYPK